VESSSDASAVEATKGILGDCDNERYGGKVTYIGETILLYRVIPYSF
jgi:hypothetical protein